MFIQSEVLGGRLQEVDILAQDARAQRRPRVNYIYPAEPFGVRRKDFWSLALADKVLHKMIPSLSHHSDGLILQPCVYGWCFHVSVLYVSVVCTETPCPCL